MLIVGELLKIKTGQAFQGGFINCFSFKCLSLSLLPFLPPVLLTHFDSAAANSQVPDLGLKLNKKTFEL